MAAGVCAFCVNPKKLILPEEKEIESADDIIMIPLNRVRCNEVALRQVDHNSKLFHQMVYSVRQAGVLNPIVVRTLERLGYYGVIDGLYRVHAAHRAGHREIPARVVKLYDYQVNIIESAKHVRTKPCEMATHLHDS